MENILTKRTIALHWLVALPFIGMLATGLYMKNTETWWLYSIHKSIGVILFTVILVRVIWRIKRGWPKPVRAYEKIEQILSKATHWLLILGTLAMPLSGMLLSAASGHGFGVFGLALMPSNPSPTTLGEVVPFSEGLYAFSAGIHEWAGYLLVATVLLHVAGALKHHFFDRDKTLLRMLNKVG